MFWAPLQKSRRRNLRCYAPINVNPVADGGGGGGSAGKG